MLAQADELVVLPDYVRSALAEVEREGGLFCTEIVDVEDELLGEILWRAPEDPANAGVDLSNLIRSDSDV